MSSNLTTKLGQFRSELYLLFPKRRDAIMNLLDALTCNGHQCKSVVQLSNSKSFERQYSSITDAIADGLSEANWDDVCRLVYRFTASDVTKAPHRFIVDCTPSARPFARKLADRGVVHHPNPAPGNKPICVGHQYSLLSLLPNEILENQKHWLVPLSVERVASDLKGQELGMQQISESVETFDIGNELFISVGDSLYGTEPCRVKVSEKENWVHIFRLNSARNVYRPMTLETSHTKGRKKVYGAQMNLVKAKTHLPHDRETTLYQTSKKGHPLKVMIKCWDNMVVRGSQDFQSFKHPLNIHQVEVFNDAGDKLFQRPLWIAVFGKRRHEISLEGAYAQYRSRYDTEPATRSRSVSCLSEETACVAR
jgi:DDE superfamily endonuclease